MRFFLNLKDDHELSDEWGRIMAELSSLDAPPTALREKLQAFLAKHGYATTPEVVLRHIQSGSLEKSIADSMPNRASDRFVQDILTSENLFEQYMAACDEAVARNDPQYVAEWLDNKGYKCTAAQVDASFRAMRDVNFNLWAGIYGDTKLRANGSDQTGPVLTLWGDDSVSLGESEIINPSYKSGTLEWTALTGKRFNNTTSASLTFSRIYMARNPGGYLGNIFKGTLAYENGQQPPRSYEFRGRLGSPPVPPPDRAPDASGNNPTAVEAFWIGLAGLGVTAAALITQVIFSVRTDRREERRSQRTDALLRAQTRQLTELHRANLAFNGDSANPSRPSPSRILAHSGVLGQNFSQSVESRNSIIEATTGNVPQNIQLAEIADNSRKLDETRRSRRRFYRPCLPCGVEEITYSSQAGVA
jgi:hypothetical protein